MTEKQERRSLSAWDPFAELQELAGFGRASRGFPRFVRLFDDLDVVPSANRGVFVPAVDVHESEKEWTLTAEVAGAKPEDVNVEIENGVLTIRGEKRSEREEKREHGRVIERSYGSFRRSFTLPSSVAADRVEAGFKDGVLTITIPKAEAPKPHVVAIKS